MCEADAQIYMAAMEGQLQAGGGAGLPAAEVHVYELQNTRLGH